MPYKINEKQFMAINSLSDHDRYKHFISKVADWHEIWSVRTSEGWLVPATPEGIEYLPLWPHLDYAQRIADEIWPGHVAEEFDYEFLVNEGFNQLGEDGVKIAVFPNMDWQCVLVDARQLLDDLKTEGLKYS